MRESPSCVVTLRHFGLWRAAVAAVAFAAMAAVTAWAAATLASLSAATSGPVIATAIVLGLGLGAALAVVSLGRVESGVLACVDGRWSFAPDRAPDRRPEPGDLAVAIDLGSFLLLTLTAGDRGGRRARRWLPVQRRGLERGWHTLRCAVYSPPPDAPGTLAADEPLPE
jgi:hypothetical protein